MVTPPTDPEASDPAAFDPAGDSLAGALERRRRTLLHRLSVALFVAAAVIVVVVVLGAVFTGRHRNKVSTLSDQAAAGAAAGPAGGSSVAGGSVDPAGPVTAFDGTVLPDGPFRGFGEVAATVEGAGDTAEHPCLLAATDEVHRERGLMHVTDPSLAGHAGMVFDFPVAQQEPFWMRNTPMPLSIAFYGADGRFVSSTDMAPCGDSPQCPNFLATGPYTMAVEVPQGQLRARGFVAGSSLQLGGACQSVTDPSSRP